MAGVLCLVALAAALDFGYHHTEELEAYLREVHAAHPSLTHLHSIGRSVEGRCGQDRLFWGRAGSLPVKLSSEAPRRVPVTSCRGLGWRRGC